MFACMIVVDIVDCSCLVARHTASFEQNAALGRLALHR